MADVIASRGALLQAFKEIYGEKVAEQQNRRAFIYNEFEKSNRRTSGGKYWTVPMQDEGGQAVGSYNEDEETSDAQSEVYKEIQILPRQHYAGVQLTGLAMASAKGNLRAFIDAKDSEIKNKTKNLIARLNCNYYQRGDGRIGTALSSADAPDAIVMSVGTNMNWFRKGMKIDVFAAAAFPTTKRNGAHGTKKQGWQITAVNKATRTLSFGNVNPNAAGVISGDIVVYEDTQDSSSVGATSGATDTAGKNILGLRSLVDDTTEGPTTVQNIDRSVFPIFKGNVLSNSGTARPLSLDLMQLSIDTCEIESGDQPDWMVAGYGQRRNYLNLLWYDVRYGPRQLRGGYEVLKYNHLDFVVDKDCEPGRAYFGLKESLKRYVIQEIGILDEATASGFERQSKKDVYELLIGGYWNLGMDRPNTWLKLIDLTEPS